MKVRIAVMAVMMAAMLPAYAGSKDIKDLAAYTGMSTRKVKMILGPRTAYAEYRYTYHRYQSRFVKALGETNYERLMKGEAVRLGNGVAVQIRAADSVAKAD